MVPGVKRKNPRQRIDEMQGVGEWGSGGQGEEETRPLRLRGPFRLPLSRSPPLPLSSSRGTLDLMDICSLQGGVVKGGTSMRVDCQSHVFPPAYAELLLQSTSSLRAEKVGDVYRISYGDLQEYRLQLEMFDPAAKLRDMDAEGIDVAVLSVTTPGPELLPADLGVRAARACNDYPGDADREASRAGSWRWRCCHSRTWGPPWRSMTERLASCGFRGVMLFSNIHGCSDRRSDVRSAVRAGERGIGFRWSCIPRCRAGRRS